MTDKEIIEAFLNSDEKKIRDAYVQLRPLFDRYVRNHCTYFNMNYLEDAYQDAIIRLQTNILSERITLETLTVPVQGYLNKIGYRVVLELTRSQKELIEGSTAWDVYLNQLDTQASAESEEAIFGLEALWVYEVDNEFSRWRQKNPTATEDEQNDEYDRLTDEFTQKHCSARQQVDDFEKDTMDDILQSEREKVILNIVMDMGEPCATILKGSFWQEKSIAALTHEMKYSSSDTTKNQKSRCLRRLKSFIVNKLRKLGYDY